MFETRHTNPRSPPRFPHTLASNLYPPSLLTLPPKSIFARSTPLPPPLFRFAHILPFRTLFANFTILAQTLTSLLSTTVSHPIPSPFNSALRLSPTCKLLKPLLRLPQSQHPYLRFRPPTHISPLSTNIFSAISSPHTLVKTPFATTTFAYHTSLTQFFL